MGQAGDQRQCRNAHPQPRPPRPAGDELGPGLRAEPFLHARPGQLPGGQYTATLRIRQNSIPAPPETITLPRLLKPYGYHSANIGKLHFVPRDNRDHRVPHLDHGFDYLEINDVPDAYECAWRAWVRRVAPDQLGHLSFEQPR